MEVFHMEKKKDDLFQLKSVLNKLQNENKDLSIEKSSLEGEKRILKKN